MKPPSLAALVLCALGIESALAVPSVHHNVHRHVHKKKDVYTGNDWRKVFMPSNVAGHHHHSATPTPAAAPPPEAPPPPPPAPADSSPPASGGTTDADGFTTTGFGGHTTPRDNGNNDQYVGNVGIPYGSNIQTVSAGAAGGYKYTNEFQSSCGDTMTIYVWNKSGPDGQPNSGQFSEPALQFNLAPGATQFVAFDENSQVAWCHFRGTKTAWGANDCTFGEADFGDLRNKQYSGYDVSSIQNTNGNDTPMTITCPNGETSSNTGNNYINDSQPGGIGGNLPPGKVRLTTIMG